MTRYHPIKIGRFRTSKRELVDITKAWFAISLAFTFIFSDIGLNNLSGIISIEFLIILLASLFTAGLGFLLHEIGHKIAAQHYGCEAEFRSDDSMLYLAVGMAFVIGFLFAAPGAVMIAGHISRRQNGIISLAGPAVNYVLAVLFLGLSMVIPLFGVWKIGAMVNAWLGLFNLIPFGNFDGKKILFWNNWVWLSMVATGVFLVFF